MPCLKQFLKDYPEHRARSILESYRWPNQQVSCPRCGGTHLYKERRKGQPGFYRCPASHSYDLFISGKPYVFSVRGDTILDSSRMPLSKWLYCLTHLDSSTINFISVGDLAVKIDVTRKTAARQIELLAILNKYFSKDPCKPRPPSSFTEWAHDKFFQGPNQNAFLFRYQHEKEEERRLERKAEREADNALSRRNSFLLSSMF